MTPRACLLAVPALVAITGCGSPDPDEPQKDAAKAEVPSPEVDRMMEMFSMDGPDDEDAVQAGTMEIVLHNAAGEELIAGVYDSGAQAFIEGSVRIFGKLPEELVEGETFTDYVTAAEMAAMEPMSSPEMRDEFVAAQGLYEEEEPGAHQLLMAYGGLMMMIGREASPAAPPREDPCDPPADKDFCTWSPEFYPRACCLHDECYARCATNGSTRLECDDEFLANMASEASFWTRPFITVYYKAVRAFGKPFYACG